LRETSRVPGIVHLVGAGPGDPGLMTRRSLELIAAADAILYDRLIPSGALEGAREDCELIYVGKRPGDAAMEQEAINGLLVEYGQAGGRVVRLKGGDPFVFGRGGEEAEALRAAGVPFEVVPGVTAGVAAPAYAGIPVTHRDAASAVAFVTGHEGEPAKDSASVPNPSTATSALDWGALARFPGTLVFYMGVKNLPLIAERLTAGGRDGAEPVAVVAQGTLPSQQTVTGTLADIAQCVSQAGISPPAITVVGPAAALHEMLAWLEQRPLHGVSVAVTRARRQASGLAARLAELGAAVVETPAIRIDPRPVEGEIAAAVDAVGEYDLACLTSGNAVEALFDALGARGRDARSLAGVTVAAIGPSTARALARRGVRAEIVPEHAVAEALLEALTGTDVDGRRVLLPQAAQARDTLAAGLTERGAHVDVVAFYDTGAERFGDAEREALAGVDYVTFTSSSTVLYLMDALDARWIGEPTRVASIGPVTSATAREQGLEVHVEAERHDVEGLVDALVADAAKRR
jgi:uroporphyrinogen III methyltransferase / synthase